MQENRPTTYKGTDCSTGSQVELKLDEGYEAGVVNDFEKYVTGEMSSNEVLDVFLKVVSVDHPKVVELTAFTENESERGAALTSVAFFDIALEELLLEYFKFGVERFGAYRDEKSVLKAAKELLRFESLGSFSTKLHLAYALGLLEETTFQNLKIAGNIRNKFAHHIAVSSFENEPIKQMVSRLKLTPENEDYRSLNGIQKFGHALGAAFTTVTVMTTMLQKGFPVNTTVFWKDGK